MMLNLSLLPPYISICVGNLLSYLFLSWKKLSVLRSSYFSRDLSHVRRLSASCRLRPCLHISGQRIKGFSMLTCIIMVHLEYLSHCVLTFLPSVDSAFHSSASFCMTEISTKKSCMMEQRNVCGLQTAQKKIKILKNNNF